MLKKIFLAGAPIWLVLSLSACSLGGGQANQAADAGIFKSVNKGETWQQTALIPTVTGRPGSLGAVSVNTFVMDPSDHNGLYLGSVGQGLFYSYDGAASWQMAAGLGNATIRSVAVDPQYKCTLYAAVGNRLLQSTDCSRSWSQVYYDSDPKIAVNTVAIDYGQSAKIYIGTARGEVVRSQDRGQSWATIARLDNNIIRLLIDPVDSKIIFAVTEKKGIHRSRDGGQNWTDLSNGLKGFPDSRDFKVMVISPAKPGLIYLATGFGLIRSSDWGDTWESIELIPPDKKASINGIAVNPKDPQEIYYVTNTAFLRSTDGGASWITKRLPTSKNGWRLAIDPENPNVVYLAVWFPVK